ncbi:MAG: GNAT family N-acetyltransferase [Clostridia bacterium]|nr:GNAT family N-acetyltransferase [Clostridia bacterium]
MKIRKAEERDIPRLNDLLYQVHLLHATGRPDIFRTGNKKYTDAELCAILSDARTPVFVAVDDTDCVMGYAFCVYEEVKGDLSLMDRKTLYIDDLCVDEGLRGQHIGASLYRYVLDVAQKNGCSAVTLNVWCLNAGAMKFYEKCGMTPLKVVMEQTLEQNGENV